MVETLSQRRLVRSILLAIMRVVLRLHGFSPLVITVIVVMLVVVVDLPVRVWPLPLVVVSSV